MNIDRFFISASCLLALFLASCAGKDKKDEQEMKVREENVTYTGDSVTMHGYVAYDESREGARPAVIVVPEWWGLNDHARDRARRLAEMGYIAMAIDLYGEGKTADNPDSAKKLAIPFYMDPEMTRRRFVAAVDKLKTYSQTDGSRLAAIGFCFGGTQVLNMARMGEDLKAVVSFHGGLLGVPADKSLLKADVLICHGAADPMVPQEEVDQFRNEMDSAGLRYTFKAYEGATHAFTNPNATAMGEKFNMPISYNAAADSASWNDMQTFFRTIFK